MKLKLDFEKTNKIDSLLAQFTKKGEDSTLTEIIELHLRH